MQVAASIVSGRSKRDQRSTTIWLADDSPGSTQFRSAKPGLSGWWSILTVIGHLASKDSDAPNRDALATSSAIKTLEAAGAPDLIKSCPGSQRYCAGISEWSPAANGTIVPG